MKKKVIALMLITAILFIPVMSYGFSASEVVIDETVLEPKDPILATVVAIGPGLFVHGFGHYFTEDYKMGLLLSSVEILSIGLMLFGALENTNPDLFRIYGADEEIQARRTGAWIFGAGFLAFLGSWFIDIFTAGDSAKQYNIEHNLEFKMEQETMGAGATYALLYNFKY